MIVSKTFIKNIRILAFVFFFLSLTACQSFAPEPYSQSVLETTSALPSSLALSEDNAFQSPDLDHLLESFSLPASPNEAPPIRWETDNDLIPKELILQFSHALYTDSLEHLMEKMNQVLTISPEEFTLVPNENDGDDLSEQNLLDAIKDGFPHVLFYQLDIDGDGLDEILAIEDLAYEYSWSNTAWLLKKQEDNYCLAGYKNLSYYRFFSIFSYKGNYYLAANYDNYKTQTTKAVGLFLLDTDNSSLSWSLWPNYVFLRKNGDDYRYHSLYENSIHPLIKDTKAYIKDIAIDLIYADRIGNTFLGTASFTSCGNCQERLDEYSSCPECQEEYDGCTQSPGECDHYPKYQKECNNCQENAGKCVGCTGYSEEWGTDPECPEKCVGYTQWQPKGYTKHQRWAREIQGKTVIFSLYQKISQDSFLLDARVLESQKTTVLLDYVIDLDTAIIVANYWDYDDNNITTISYEDPEISLALPDNLWEFAEDFAKKVQGDFKPAAKKDSVIPQPLIEAVEKALFEGSPYALDLPVNSTEIDSLQFSNTFYGTDEELQNNMADYVYSYHLGQENYYLLVTDTGGSARLVDIVILKETEGELVFLDGWTSLDLYAKVIEYEGSFYLLERSYNYYSKHTDSLTIYQMTPQGVGPSITFNLVPVSYHLSMIYSDAKSWEKEIKDYIESIQEELMDLSTINDDIQFFSGKESLVSDKDRSSRLKSVGKDCDYWEIDFNNDKTPEYVYKHFWFPSNSLPIGLETTAYQFTSRRITEIETPFYTGNASLLQLWFQEFQGKVFTFRLFFSLDHYVLNVSLIENSRISQIQTWVIAPEYEIR